MEMGWDVTSQLAPYLREMLRALEMNIIYNELLHSYHVQALMVPEVARDPAMQRFGQTSAAALHALVAAAGFVRRMLIGEFTPEVVRGLAEQLQEMQRHQAEAMRALRELSARPEAARLMPLQAMRGMMMQMAPIHRTAMAYGQTLLGAFADPMGTAEPEQAELPRD